jgi:hypothetical protein
MKLSLSLDIISINFIQNFIEYASLKVKSNIEEIIGDQQRGFQRKISTTDQIFCICQILEKKLEYTDSTVKNFKKAYDSVWEGSIVQYPQ